MGWNSQVLWWVCQDYKDKGGAQFYPSLATLLAGVPRSCEVVSSYGGHSRGLGLACPSPCTACWSSQVLARQSAGTAGITVGAQVQSNPMGTASGSSWDLRISLPRCWGSREGSGSSLCPHAPLAGVPGSYKVACWVGGGHRRSSGLVWLYAHHWLEFPGPTWWSAGMLGVIGGARSSTAWCTLLAGVPESCKVVCWNGESHKSGPGLFVDFILFFCLFVCFILFKMKKYFKILSHLFLSEMEHCYSIFLIILKSLRLLITKALEDNKISINFYSFKNQVNIIQYLLRFPTT